MLCYHIWMQYYSRTESFIIIYVHNPLAYVHKLFHRAAINKCPQHQTISLLSFVGSCDDITTSLHDAIHECIHPLKTCNIYIYLFIYLVSLDFPSCMRIAKLFAVRGMCHPLDTTVKWQQVQARMCSFHRIFWAFLAAPQVCIGPNLYKGRLQTKILGLT